MFAIICAASRFPAGGILFIGFVLQESIPFMMELLGKPSGHFIEQEPGSIWEKEALLWDVRQKRKN